jgi:pyrophosphatase PpaX
MTEAALFDWDGTLLDSREALLGAWHAASHEVTGRRFPADAAEERLVFTQPGAKLFPRVAGSEAGAIRLGAAFQRAYETTGERVRAFPGVIEMLASLRDEGIATGVVTSKARLRFEADARRIGVRELVDVAVCQEDSPTHKPHPAPVVHALGALGVAPGHAVLAGDTPVDVVAGVAAGVTCVGVRWGASDAGALLEAGAIAVARDTGELALLVLQGCRESEMIGR